MGFKMIRDPVPKLVDNISEKLNLRMMSSQYTQRDVMLSVLTHIYVLLHIGTHIHTQDPAFHS